MQFSKIIGTGAYLPETVLSNFELEKRVDTSHAWIVERTGIEARHIANAKETTTMMGVEAAKKALEAAHLLPDQIDMVIAVTCTPDKVFPAAACLMQAALGIPAGPAFDIHAACSGFIYGLSVADKFIRSGSAKNILVVGSETLSRIVNWQDRKTCVLFGDGAGAVVLQASERPGVLSTYLGADGCQQGILYCDNAIGATVEMQGNAVFKLAVNMLGEVAEKILIENKLTTSDIHWLVPHQANIRIIKATADKLKLPMEKVVVTITEQGNTSGASIPLALDAYIRGGRITRGQNLLLEAFGGGLTWGAALINY